MPLPFYNRYEPFVFFDPFEMRHLSSLNGPVAMAALTLSSLTDCLVLLTISLFVKYKRTPIVKHTNLMMSGIQLSLHFVLSVGSFLLVCMSRPLVI